MKTGTVKFYNTNRGFGFIEAEGGGPDVFVHVSNLPERIDHLSEGQRVSFEERISKRSGKNEAVNVQIE